MDTTAQIVYGNGLSDGTFLLVGAGLIFLFVVAMLLFYNPGGYTGHSGSSSCSSPGDDSPGFRPLTDYERSIDYNDPKYDPPHHVF